MRHFLRFHRIALPWSIIMALCCGSLRAFDEATPRIEWDPASLTLIEPNAVYGRILRLSNGSLVCCFSQEGSVWTKESRDEGRTWDEKRLVCPPQTGRLTNSEMLQLQSGAVLYFFNDRPQDDMHPYAIGCCRSDDNGQTWSPPTVLFQGGVEWGNGCWEPAAIQLPTGEILLVFANESPYRTSAEQEISLMRSQDDGTTWSAPTAVSFRKGHRDGMPVPLLLQGDRPAVVVAIEDSGLTGVLPGFRPSIVALDIRQNGDIGLVEGDSALRWPALRQRLPLLSTAGAPYLRQMLDGTTILSFQYSDWSRPQPLMHVYIGDSSARNFTNRSIPFDVPPNVSCLWNSLFVKSANVITAVSQTTIQGKAGLWTIDGRIVRTAKPTDSH